MKFRKTLCLLTIVCLSFVGLSLTGCQGPMTEKTMDEIGQKLLVLQTYTCTVTMLVTNNKSTMTYKMKHYYQKPDKYRIEILEPKELQGQTTIYNGKEAAIYHPGIKQYLRTEKFTDSVEHNAFIGAFLQYMSEAGKAQVTKEQLDGAPCHVLQITMPGKNDYMQTQKLWIDALQGIPQKAEIYDKNGKVTVEVLYDSFDKNPKPDDKLFEIKKQ